MRHRGHTTKKLWGGQKGAGAFPSGKRTRSKRFWNCWSSRGGEDKGDWKALGRAYVSKSGKEGGSRLRNKNRFVRGGGAARGGPEAGVFGVSKK